MISDLGPEPRRTSTPQRRSTDERDERAEDDAATSMRVKKRDGDREPVDVNKIVRAVSRCCAGLVGVDALRVALKTINGLYDGATTRELDRLSIQTAAALIVDEPEYARLAARLLATYVDKEVRGQEIHAFSQSIAAGHRLGLINDRLADFAQRNARKLNDCIDESRSLEYVADQRLAQLGMPKRYGAKNPLDFMELQDVQELANFFERRVSAYQVGIAGEVELGAAF
jgi:ribonucleoside-diphosphate reductase alpha chain